MILTGLAMLNLEHTTFELMGGFRSKSAYDAAYGIVLTITMWSYVVLPVLLVMYLWLAVKANRTAPRGTLVDRQRTE